MERFIFAALLVVALSLSGTGADPQCPSRWASSDGYCYKVFKEYKRWDDAEMFCRREVEGGHLVSIHSEREAKFLARLVFKKFILLNVWIGLSSSGKHGNWRWSDGSSFYYTSWALREPNNFLWNKYCVGLVSITGHPKWNYQNCRSKRYFVCKAQPQGEGSTW
ncbi:C-type lectin lectoxin-Lio1 [Erythrolamprus reginae]|uniref:C-type lectin lectoxin-Lio1 n=1 Tax=Erythrolamprus reginae TaxID=121349 RepID=UPI00396C6A88